VFNAHSVITNVPGLGSGLLRFRADGQTTFGTIVGSITEKSTKGDFLPTRFFSNSDLHAKGISHCEVHP